MRQGMRCKSSSRTPVPAHVERKVVKCSASSARPRRCGGGSSSALDRERRISRRLAGKGGKYEKYEKYEKYGKTGEDG